VISTAVVVAEEVLRSTLLSSIIITDTLDDVDLPGLSLPLLLLTDLTDVTLSTLKRTSGKSSLRT
jgi:hypothetical protein